MVLVYKKKMTQGGSVTCLRLNQVRNIKNKPETTLKKYNFDKLMNLQQSFYLNLENELQTVNKCF